MTQRPAENLPWIPTVAQPIQPHDDEDMPEIEHKTYFSSSRFYCVETICAPCGVVIVWAKFAKSESPTKFLAFLEQVFNTEQSKPDYICIDKACNVLKTALRNGSWVVLPQLEPSFLLLWEINYVKLPKYLRS